MGIQEMTTKFGKPEIKSSFGHLGENGKILKRLNLNTNKSDVDWIQLALNRN
jgi:hypothetical protein